MARAPSDIGDELGVSATNDTGKKSYPLARTPNNVSYDTVSEQPEAEPNQPLSIPLSFHGGLAYSTYDPQQAGAFINNGMLTQEPNIIRPPIAPTAVTLTGAQSPPMYFFEAEAPDATLAFDATSNDTGSSVTTVTVSHTVGSGNNRLLLVGISYKGVSGGANIDAIAYGGVSLTHLAFKFSSGVGTVEFWYLKSPISGAADIQVDFDASVNAVAGATSWSGVNQDTSFGTSVTATGSSLTPSVTVATASGEFVADVVVVGEVRTSTAGANQTERWDASATISGNGSTQAGSDGGVMSETLSGAGTPDWATLAIPIKPAPSPVLYNITIEDAEVNVYKISLANSNFGTLLNTKTFSVTTTQPCGKPVEWNDGSNTKWYLGLGDNNFIQRLTTIVSGTSADTWTASGDADARHLKIVGNQLMRSTDENQMSVLAQGADPLTEANWGGDFFVGDVSANITELGEAGGLGYIAKEDGFYEWDLVGEAANVFPEIGKATRNGQGMVYWHGGFLIPGGNLWWTRTGTPVGPDSNPENRANDPSLGSTSYFKHGRWMGLATFGAYHYGLCVSSTGTSAYLAMGRERNETDLPGWGPLVWQTLDLPTVSFNDFHGCFITETSRFSDSQARPCLWYAHRKNVRYVWLDKDGAPMSRRGNIDLATSGSVTSGRIDGGMPNVPKQLWAIEGWAEDFGSVIGSFQFNVYRDGGSSEAVGSTITSDGFFREFWTQDTNDTTRTQLINVTWTGTSSLTDTNGPHLRDVVVREVALPRTSREWTFLFAVEDEQSKTAKLIRSELEAYVGDLKKYTLPDRDTFNGVMGKPRMLRADEINRLTPRNQEPPHYVIAASVREMSGS